MGKTLSDKLTEKLQRRQRGSEFLYYSAIGVERDLLLRDGWEQVGTEPVLWNGNSLYNKYTMRRRNPALTSAA